MYYILLVLEDQALHCGNIDERIGIGYTRKTKIQEKALEIL